MDVNGENNCKSFVRFVLLHAATFAVQSFSRSYLGRAIVAGKNAKHTG